MNEKLPLVSIAIPNYNYGKYLRRCLDSILKQTYPNIEIIVQDNNSKDESYEILREYERRSFEGEIRPYINIGRNKRNVGSDRNSLIVEGRAEGEYLVFLSSDDALKEHFVERCVQVLEKNLNVGMVMVHRDEIDENDNLHETIPFFDRDFIAEGESQAAVFMMAGVAVPSQIMIRKKVRDQSMRNRNYSFQIAGDWYSNFLMSCEADVAYLKEALCEYRIHSGNETNESEKKMLGIFEHFQLINVCNATAETLHMTKCTKKYEAAVTKLASMCVRYAHKMLCNQEEDCARKYLYLAPVFDETILQDERYVKLWDMIHHQKGKNLQFALEEFDQQYHLDRTISYEPPENFREINATGEIIS